LVDIEKDAIRNKETRQRVDPLSRPKHRRRSCLRQTGRGEERKAGRIKKILNKNI